MIIYSIFVSSVCILWLLASFWNQSVSIFYTGVVVLNPPELAGARRIGCHRWYPVPKLPVANSCGKTVV